MLCKEKAAALEPDRLEAWYPANGDAQAITSLAGQIAQQADSCWLGTVGGREVQPNNPALFDKQVGKHVAGTKRHAAYYGTVVDHVAIVGCTEESVGCNKAIYRGLQRLL